MLDMDFAISVYLETLDEARRKAEEAGREALRQERALVGESIGAALAKIANQDLTYRLTSEMPDAYRELQADFNEAIETLEGVMQHVSGTASAIHSSTREIAAAADDLSQRTEQQAASLEETAAALHEIAATVEKSAEGATLAHSVVAVADEDAKKSAVVVRERTMLAPEFQLVDQRFLTVAYGKIHLEKLASGYRWEGGGSVFQHSSNFANGHTVDC
jgi:methyl-accepting chemotaxis protein